jgi:hypothetical protein
MKVCIVELDGTQWVVKTATTEDEAARLQHEAAQLQRAAHPGVVEIGLVEVPVDEAGAGVELRTRYAGISLRQRGPMPAAELCGLGAAVATVLADLHDIGIVHGAVHADHILIGGDGRPMLCGFGASTSTEAGDASLDARGLTATLSDFLGPDAPRRLVRVLRQDLSVRRSITSARALAAALGATMPDRRLPAPEDGGAVDPDLSSIRPANRDGPSPGDGGPDGGAEGLVSGAGRRRLRALSRGASTLATAAAAPSTPAPEAAATAAAAPSEPASTSASATTPHRRIGGAVLVAVVVAAIVAVVSAVGVSRISGQHRPTVACPPADRGCGPVPVHNGAFVTTSGTFTTGLPDPVVVLGRFACGTASLPAALDPRNGRIWTWLTWAGPTRAVTATAVTAPSGATTLRVRPEASGCDQLEVIDAAGTATVLGFGRSGAVHEAKRDA